ncbi:hypothetical protein lerEdw1_005999 [Lerista edwardsae]|nr:hypothetical protein lerEdw1_005999 [Lerista edwardsae]
MSLSNQPPAPLSEYSQLCKAKNTDSFSEAFHCMEAQKDFGKTEFEWQRTEGKLNEIGLTVNSGGQRKDGLINKSTGFTDEDKLCFFEGKLGKDLKTAPKDTREIEAQGKKYQADPGHLESWSMISEPFPSAEGSLETLKIAGFHSGQAESTRLPARLGQNEAITDQEKVAGKKAGVVEVAKCQQELPSLPQPGSNLNRYAKESESSMWNPSFSPLLPSVLGCPEATGKKDGVPSYSVIGIINDSYGQSGSSSSPTAPRLGPPTTTVELAQDEFRSGCFNNIHEMEEEPFLDEKFGLAGSGSPLLTGAPQRKAMRRAMSECSHLSVPQALNLADKYPEPVAREDLVSGLVLLSGSLSPSSSPMTRKPSAPMKRSATVSEEQTSAHSPGAVQNNAELPSLLVKEHQSLPMEEPSARKRDEWDGSGSAVRRELVSPGQYHSKLEQIPELGGHSQAGRGEAAAEEKERSNVAGEAKHLGSPGSSRASEMEASKAAAVLGRQEIEVSSVASAPSSQQGAAPRDGMLLNFPSPESRQTVVKELA